MPTPPPRTIPGMFVALQGLDAADLNNRLGIVHKSLHNGLYVVETEGANRITVMATNMVSIPQPSKAWACRKCRVTAYWSTSPTPGWTGAKGKWVCPSCSSARQDAARGLT